MDISRNAMLGYPNIADLATLSGGSWAAGLPLENINDRVVRRVARSGNTNNASTQFKISFAADQTFKLIALVNHNLSLDSQYRITHYADAGFTTLIDDTGMLDVWQPIFATLALNWRDPNWWSGKPVLTSIRPDLASIANYRWSLLHIYQTDKTARYIKVEIFDSSNPIGYINIGRLFISRIFQPLHNMSWSASVSYESFTTTQVNKRSGQEFFDITPGRRIASVKFDHLLEHEAMLRLDAQRMLDIHGEVFFIWDPLDIQNRVRRCFLARQYDLNAIDLPYVNNYANQIEFREIL